MNTCMKIHTPLNNTHTHTHTHTHGYKKKTAAARRCSVGLSISLTIHQQGKPGCCSMVLSTPSSVKSHDFCYKRWCKHQHQPQNQNSKQPKSNNMASKEARKDKRSGRCEQREARQKHEDRRERREARELEGRRERREKREERRGREPKEKRREAREKEDEPAWEAWLQKRKAGAEERPAPRHCELCRKAVGGGLSGWEQHLRSATHFASEEWARGLRSWNACKAMGKKKADEAWYAYNRAPQKEGDEEEKKKKKKKERESCLVVDRADPTRKGGPPDRDGGNGGGGDGRARVLTALWQRTLEEIRSW